VEANCLISLGWFFNFLTGGYGVETQWNPTPVWRVSWPPVLQVSKSRALRQGVVLFPRPEAGG
jgi:hypothetical protein